MGEEIPDMGNLSVVWPAKMATYKGFYLGIVFV